jgi:hypothetical protein
MNDELAQLPHLSAAGLDRREAILAAAKLHARRRRTRRRSARMVAAGAILIGAGVLFSMRPDTPVPSVETVPAVSHVPTASPVAPEPIPVLPSKPTYARFDFSTIQTNDARLTWQVVSPRAQTVIVLSDDQLLASLHDVGVDAGLARVGSQSLLVLNDTFKPSPTR